MRLTMESCSSPGVQARFKSVSTGVIRSRSRRGASGHLHWSMHGRYLVIIVIMLFYTTVAWQDAHSYFNLFPGQMTFHGS